jgi:hypothetical protein
MAGECKVFQMRAPRDRNAPVRPVPFLAYDAIDDEQVLELDKGTTLVTITSSVAGTIDFGTSVGATPGGTDNPFPISEGVLYDFDVLPGLSLRFDAA